jgi:hypothetical protein
VTRRRFQHFFRFTTGHLNTSPSLCECFHDGTFRTLSIMSVLFERRHFLLCTLVYRCRPATSSELVKPCQTLSRYTNRVRIGEAQRSGHRFDTPESSSLFVSNRVPLVGIWSPLPQPDRCGASGRRLFPGWDLRASCMRAPHVNPSAAFRFVWCVLWMILVVRLVVRDSLL